MNKIVGFFPTDIDIELADNSRKRSVLDNEPSKVVITFETPSSEVSAADLATALLHADEIQRRLYVLIRTHTLAWGIITN